MYMNPKLKSKLLDNSCLKKIAENSDDIENFLKNAFSSNVVSADADLYMFFMEEDPIEIRKSLVTLGYQFRDSEMTDSEIPNSFSWNYNLEILDYLDRKYSNHIITIPIKKLVNEFEVNNLLNKMDDISFFYCSSDDQIASELEKEGYMFSVQGDNFPSKFDKLHPESYYQTTRNIPEMKLKMIEDGIRCDGRLNNFYKQLFRETDEEIESYFASKITRKEEILKDVTGALIRQPSNIKHEQLHYRMIDLHHGDWYCATEWMRFFIELGSYVENYSGKLNVFVSYVDCLIPAALFSLGIMDGYFEKVKKNETKVDDVIEEYQSGKVVKYFDGSNWRESTVVGVRIDGRMEEKFNPYLDIEVKYPNEPIAEVSVPHNLWGTKIRGGGVGKGAPGKGNIVRFDDRISEVIEQRYSQEAIARLRVQPELHVNMIGRGIDKKLREIHKGIQFSNADGSFLMTDYLYFDNDSESNYVNVHVVNSEKATPIQNTESISIFVGAKVGNDLKDYQSNRNLYLTSRIRENYIDDTEILINQLQQQTELSQNEQLTETAEIRKHMKSKKIHVPKGVEIYVF